MTASFKQCHDPQRFQKGLCVLFIFKNMMPVPLVFLLHSPFWVKFVVVVVFWGEGGFQEVNSYAIGM